MAHRAIRIAPVFLRQNAEGKSIGCGCLRADGATPSCLTSGFNVPLIAPYYCPRLPARRVLSFISLMQHHPKQVSHARQLSDWWR